MLYSEMHFDIKTSQVNLQVQKCMKGLFKSLVRHRPRRWRASVPLPSQFDYRFSKFRSYLGGSSTNFCFTRTRKPLKIQFQNLPKFLTNSALIKSSHAKYLYKMRSFFHASKFLFLKFTNSPIRIYKTLKSNWLHPPSGQAVISAGQAPVST